MAFLISQNNGGIIPGLEYLPAGAITPQIGMALVMTDGKLAACGATTRPQYICATAAESALKAGTPCSACSRACSSPRPGALLQAR